MNYYRRYVGDMQADTMSITCMEQGVYDRLLDHYYASEKPVPLNTDRAALICRALTLEERAAVQMVLSTYFEKRTDGWYHARVEKELALSRQRSKAGKEGADVRWDDKQDGKGNGKPIANDMAKPMLIECPPINQPPTTNTNPQIPDTPCAPATPAPRSKSPGKGAPSWNAYARAYFDRYGVDPARNGKVNRNLCDLVDRLGESDAPLVAAWYVGHNRPKYVTTSHPVGLLLQDCEGLRTEWARGRKVSDTEARQADRTMATGNAFGPLIEAAKATA